MPPFFFSNIYCPSHSFASVTPYETSLGVSSLCPTPPGRFNFVSLVLSLLQSLRDRTPMVSSPPEYLRYDVRRGLESPSNKPLAVTLMAIAAIILPIISLCSIRFYMRQIRTRERERSVMAHQRRAELELNIEQLERNYLAGSEEPFPPYPHRPPSYASEVDCPGGDDLFRKDVKVPAPAHSRQGPERTVFRPRCNLPNASIPRIL
ncbi:hypothetical protein BDP27DRAFT_1321866 [Rhodocollybia butyracea]|uniref:Uncharacterized protein n=1 Tax=Rhodocollybia butyracea TaxID=206335 RepID=A0A9P5UB56_9AGAR|nr:hypothetical protein BDP27DRAFT_1321866 [Rhodocollybia butyracea]